MNRILHRFFFIALSAALLATLALGQGSRGCSLSGSEYGIVAPMLSKTTGDLNADAAFNQEYIVLCSVFEVRPSLFILNDVNGPNAFAYPASLQPGFQGTVMFGYRLLLTELFQSPVNFTVPAIMAHEFGHILQFHHGNRLPTRLKELQADYLSGWYMKYRDMLSGWTGEGIQQTLRAFYSKGDYAFNDPNHHGTPMERTAAAFAGAMDNSTSVQEAYRNAWFYVTQH